MSTIFPGSASVGQVYNNYTFDGTAWNINGIDLTENYLEESSASATYLTKVSASNTYLTQTSASTTYLPLSAATANQVVYKNSSNVAAGSSGFIYDGTHLKVNGNLESRQSSGDEGGEIILNKPATNTTITDGVVIDVHQNKLRIFEQGGNNRGVYIDLVNTSNSVGTSITPGIGGVPYRMAAGSVYVGSNSPVSVTFPSSRFSVSPIVQVTGTGGWGWFSNLSSTGVVIYQTQSWGGASQAGTMHWTAVQMTSGAADG